jgi:hypothetical protein
VVLGLIYVVLWVLAFNGATDFIGPLLVPLVLAIIVALGVALTRFMGIKPREQHFQDSEDDPTS